MAVNIPPEIDLSLIFERDDVREAMSGHCAKTHIDDEAYVRCNYCQQLRLTLAEAIVEWKAICDRGAIEGSEQRVKVRRFWLSWLQPTEDFRPLTDPPDARVLGWWCSGYDSKDRALLCALVAATNLAEAKAAIRVSWPEAPSKRQVWRSEDERTAEWLPSDRFPLSPWMQARVEHVARDEAQK